MITAWIKKVCRDCGWMLRSQNWAPVYCFSCKKLVKTRFCNVEELVKGDIRKHVYLQRIRDKLWAVFDIIIESYWLMGVMFRKFWHTASLPSRLWWLKDGIGIEKVMSVCTWELKLYISNDEPIPRNMAYSLVQLWYDLHNERKRITIKKSKNGTSIERINRAEEQAIIKILNFIRKMESMDADQEDPLFDILLDSSLTQWLQEEIWIVQTHWVQGVPKNSIPLLLSIKEKRGW